MGGDVLGDLCAAHSEYALPNERRKCSSMEGSHMSAGNIDGHTVDLLLKEQLLNKCRHYKEHL